VQDEQRKVQLHKIIKAKRENSFRMQEVSSPEGSKFNFDMSRNSGIKFNLRDGINKRTGLGNAGTGTSLSNNGGSRIFTDRGPQYSPDRYNQWPEPFGRTKASNSPKRPENVAPENSTSNLGDSRTLDPEISPIVKGRHHRGIFKADGGLAADAPKPRTSTFKLKIQELLEEDGTSKDAIQVGKSRPASNIKKSNPSGSPEKKNKEKIKLRLERKLTTEFLRTIDSDNPQIDQRAICEFPGQSAEHDFAGELKKKQMKI
jgi:hypothetical protein